MNSFSKLSLYDFLAILIPGFVILWFFHFFYLNVDCPVTGILIAILSYLTGLCYHKLMELVVKLLHLRRNKCMESYARKHFYDKLKKENDQTPIPEINSDKSIDDEYVRAYYSIAKTGCLMNIPVLEAQETFLRNMIPLIFIEIIRMGCDTRNDNVCCISIFLGVILLLSVFVWFSITIKIYELVWEGDYYLFQKEKNPTNNNQNNYEKTSD